MCTNRIGLERTAPRSRVLRGGSWINNAQNLRSANRNDNHPDNANQNIGLRLVLSFAATTEGPVNPANQSTCPGYTASGRVAANRKAPGVLVARAWMSRLPTLTGLSTCTVWSDDFRKVHDEPRPTTLPAS
jgi:hypothetical protein